MVFGATIVGEGVVPLSVAIVVLETPSCASNSFAFILLLGPKYPAMGVIEYSV